MHTKTIAGTFAKTYAGACGLRKKGAKPASVSESKRAGASSASSKRCDSCGEHFDGEALTASERANDFWRCAGCNGRIFAMLAEGGGAVRCASDQFEMADPDGWNWQRAEPAA